MNDLITQKYWDDMQKKIEMLIFRTQVQQEKIEYLLTRIAILEATKKQTSIVEPIKKQREILVKKPAIRKVNVAGNNTDISENIKANIDTIKTVRDSYDKVFGIYQNETGEIIGIDKLSSLPVIHPQQLVPKTINGRAVYTNDKAINIPIPETIPTKIAGTNINYQVNDVLPSGAIVIEVGIFINDANSYTRTIVAESQDNKNRIRHIEKYSQSVTFNSNSVDTYSDLKVENKYQIIF